jgi:hypothetical protein
MKEGEAMADIRVEINGTPEVGAREALMGERLLWTAVLKLAVDDWRSGTLRQRREAQKFLFDEKDSFGRVCARAGLEPEGFRNQCLKVGQKIAMHSLWQPPLAV